MRAVVQRVTCAQVRAGGAPVGTIGRGLLVLVGVEVDDGPADAVYLAGKVGDLRIFEDAAAPPGARRMQLAVGAIGGAVLAVPQFTLHGDVRRGRRPSFDRAAPSAAARPLYEAFVAALRMSGLTVETGAFQENMAVELVNDGPVTILIDSRKGF